MLKNSLYFGDNLKILREKIPDNSVDLIYLDPPFNSKASYNILFKEPTGQPSEAQITAFEDTWHWTDETELTFQEIVEKAPANVVEMMNAFRKFIRLNDVMAYLTMMCIRMLELHRVLKDTGSIYLHCDPTACHYLKILMDTIFSKKNFRNEIIWHYRTGNIAKKQFQRKHDVILFYSKTQTNVFDPVEIKEYYVQVYGPKFKPSFKGRKHGKDKYGEYRISFIDDVWDISAVFTLSKEHLEYPTQKPEALLERVIKASSKENDVILDPFCGCGTTVTVAQKLKRKWIGIDITHLAINLIKWRMNTMFGLEAKNDYDVIGEPEDLAGAKELASQNRYQFQWWALSLIHAKPYKEKKKGADTGIDGFLYFYEEKDVINKAIVQVKSGKVSVKDIRDLAGVIDRENALIGIFITLVEPTQPMRKEAISKGFYKDKISKKKYRRLQILTIEDLFSGKKTSTPPTISTYKKSDRVILEEQTDFKY